MRSNPRLLIKSILLTALIFFIPASSGTATVVQDGGYELTCGLWAQAVLQVATTPVTPVTLVWKEVGSDTTTAGARVVSGYFHADPKDFAYGSSSNPEMFVKIYIDPNGWANIAFNHVTVDDVIVSSSHNYNGTPDQSGTISLANRLLEHEYTGVRPPAEHNVDEFGANPYDVLSDSDAIQACIDQAKSGDTVTFTSGIGSSDYQGYLIDKTIFLVATAAKKSLTFTSTDSTNHALLKATKDLRGFVVRLYARSKVAANAGEIDDITVSHLDIDGGRDIRLGTGEDGIDNGLDDNWGSWLPECSDAGDPWCSAGSLGMDGQIDWADTLQDYTGNPANWSTGLLVNDVTITNTELGTALGFSGANGTIKDSTIRTAGDHLHTEGCADTDSDGEFGDWSDGITFTGPNHLITGNTIVDASDVGIVFFGGYDTVISNNTIRASTGNHGMFAGIAIHPWIFGNVSGVKVTGNQVYNEADSSCGGIHAGINVGTHMWNGGCMTGAHPAAIGNTGFCLADPPQPFGAHCTEGEPCQEWAHVAGGTTITLTDNYVSGAHINYLIEGLDLVGTLVESDNTSGSPRSTCWEAPSAWCEGITWGPTDRVAHHPSITGWTDLAVHCER